MKDDISAVAEDVEFTSSPFSPPKPSAGSLPFHFLVSPTSKTSVTIRVAVGVRLGVAVGAANREVGGGNGGGIGGIVDDFAVPLGVDGEVEGDQTGGYAVGTTHVPARTEVGRILGARGGKEGDGEEADEGGGYGANLQRISGCATALAAKESRRAFFTPPDG